MTLEQIFSSTATFVILLSIFILLAALLAKR
jgi:hypothetical protein